MFHVCVTEAEVRLGRCPEEGTPYYGTSYAVIATLPSGRRWVHTQGFLGATRQVDPEFGPFMARDGGEAKAAAYRLADRIKAALVRGAKLDLANHWEETDPAYGSDEYARGGYEEARWMREREDALAGFDG